MKAFEITEILNLLSSRSLYRFLSVCAGLGLMINLMLMPLVAKSGSMVPHSSANRNIFLVACLATLVLSCSAMAVGIYQCRRVATSFPRLPLSIGFAVFAFIILQQLGWLSL